MTFDDDFLQVNFESGMKRLPCKKNNIDWPPPEKLEIEGFLYERVRMSEVSDESRSQMTHVCRGAEYNFLGEAE